MNTNQNNWFTMKYKHVFCLFFILLIDSTDSASFEEPFPFTFENKIASGGCGSVFRGKRKFDPKQPNAIK